MRPKIQWVSDLLSSRVQISFELIQNATPLHSQCIVNRSLTYHLMAVTQVGFRPQISTDHPPLAHLSLFDTNCTLSGSGRPAAFSSLCTKSALTVGHQRGEEASYLTHHTHVCLDVIKDKNVIFKLLFFSFTPLSTCRPSRTSSCSQPLPHFGQSAGSDSGGGSQCHVVAVKFSLQNKRP